MENWWTATVPDLRQTYGIDVFDPAFAAAPWWHTRNLIDGLLDTPTRLSALFAKAARKTP